MMPCIDCGQTGEPDIVLACCGDVPRWRRYL